MIRALTIGAALLAAPAFAETWEIHAHKHWTVEVYDDDDRLGCRAIVSIDGGVTFSLSFDQYGFDGNVYDRNTSYPGGTEGKVMFWVDRKPEWTATANASGPLIWWDIPNDERLTAFLRELRDGSRLYFATSKDNGYDYWFSLQGSAAAISALGDCIETLQ